MKWYRLLIYLALFFGTAVSANKLVFDVFKRNAQRGELENVGSNKTEYLNLIKFMNKEYYAELRIGQPAKVFKMILDTTWADSYVPSQHCQLLEIACMLHTRYDSSKSFTYKEDGTPFSSKGPDYELSGFWSIDDFHLAHKPLLSQSFVEVTHMSITPFSFTRADGIIGLAFDSLATKNKIPFFNNLLKQNIISDAIFSFYLNRDETSETAGRLILGGTERSHVKPKTNFTNIPVINKQYWSIRIDKIGIKLSKKSKFICQKGCTAIIDTSSSQIQGPRNDIEKINSILNAREISFKSFLMYMVDCRTLAKLADIDFYIVGTKFTIKSKYYVERLVFNGLQMCLSPFMINPSGDDWLLGGAFLEQYYSEFDVDKGIITLGEAL